MYVVYLYIGSNVHLYGCATCISYSIMYNKNICTNRRGYMRPYYVQGFFGVNTFTPREDRKKMLLNYKILAKIKI